MTAPLIATPLRSTDLARTTPALTYAVRVNISGTVETLPFPASGALIAARNYWMVGDGQADAGTLGGVGDLWELLRACVDAHSVACTWGASVSAGGKGTLTSSVGVRILWGDALTTLSAIAFGFAQTDEAFAVTTHGAPSMAYGLHLPGFAPVDDTRWRQPVNRSTKQPIAGGAGRTSTFGTPQRERTITWNGISQTRALREYSPADEPRGSFESAWLEAISAGLELRYYEDAATRDPTSYSLATIAPEQVDDPLERSAQYPVEWAYHLDLVERA